MQDDESAVSHTRLAYLPALDGVRACAVLAVMMFHGGIPHMDGGFMGVDAFFVLSGFLITSLLIGEWRQALTIKLGAFWARRARRLLPALLLMLLFVAFFASVIVPKGTYGALRLDALATLLYVSNWHFILVNSNYFNETSASSPLLHTWSLAVEEQFYVIWPLVVLGGHALHPQPAGPVRPVLRGRHRVGRLDALVYDGGLNTNRAYLGTDTRSQCLFIGCALAVGLVLAHAAPPRRRAGWPRGSCGGRRARPGWLFCGVLGVVGAAGAVALWVLTTSTSSFPYSGGFFLIGLVGRRRDPRGRRGTAQHRPAAAVAGHRSATWAASRTGSTSGTGPSSYGSTTPGRGSTGTSSSRVRVARHLRRVGRVLPPHRAPDPHGDVRQPVAGVAGRARRRRCRAGGRRSRRRPGRRRSPAPRCRRHRHDGLDDDTTTSCASPSRPSRCGCSSSATRWP